MRWLQLWGEARLLAVTGDSATHEGVTEQTNSPR